MDEKTLFEMVVKAVKEARGETIPIAYAGTAIGALSSVVVYAFLVKIPALEKRIQEIADGYLEFSKQASPVLAEATRTIGEAKETLKDRRRD